MRSTPRRQRIPWIIKWLFTVFMLILVPVYWYHYGVTNFLFFCDVALFLTLIGLWLESPLLLSMPLVGIFMPQLLWCADFLALCFGYKINGMTGYMFHEHKPIYLRALSSFHGWLPWLLLFLVWRVGYEKRAFPAWSGLAIALIFFSFFFLPKPPAPPENPNLPVNVNYVFGMNEEKEQETFHPYLYLTLLILILITAIYFPVHYVMNRFAPSPMPRNQLESASAAANPNALRE